MKGPAQNDAEQVWHLLVSLVMETRGAWRRKVTEATGLSFGRVRALKRLQGDACTLGTLAEEMGIDAPAATVMINDLEARGLVERKPHPDNRRSKLVSLTAEGRQIIAALKNIEDPPPAVFAALPAAQIAQLQRALSKNSKG